MYTLSKFEANRTDGSWDIDIFVSSPLFFLFWPLSDYPAPKTWPQNQTPQQLITQSAQATADTIASVLTARMASISLSVYDWDSQGCLSFILHIFVVL